jgi:crotonobetainyl-CoA:carnitine CoA-transferase CaiB-like acyl-CoA transferase
MFLAGFRALDLSGLAGQFTGRALVDLGMEVIKVEPPGGDPVRRLGPFKDGQPHLEGSLRFGWLNAGKRSMTLDLERESGRALLRDLAAQTDLLIESFAPGQMESWELDYDRLAEANPGLVMLSISGFGEDGPYRDWLCSDAVGLAMGGLTYMSGEPSLPPVKPPETQAYYFASLQAAYTALLALIQRGRTGRGNHVHVSIQESVATLENVIRESVFDGVEIKRSGSQHKHVAPGSLFPCSDGYAYIFISRGDWEELLALWPDHPPEFDTDQWAIHAFRRKNFETVNRHLSEFTRGFSKQELMETLQMNGIPCMPVNTLGEFLEDPHSRSRELMVELRGTRIGRAEVPGFPVLASGCRMGGGDVPSVGQDTASVFRSWLGLSPADLEALFVEGII